MAVTFKALAVGFACWGIGSTGMADGPSMANVLGSYHNSSVQQSEQRISRAINQATEELGPVVRWVARNRLKEVNTATETIRISSTDGDITTDFDGLRYVAESNGEPRQNLDPEGGAVYVSYRWDGHTLHAQYSAQDGDKLYDFTPVPERKELAVHVTVRSPRLPQPLSYSLAFVPN